MIDLLEYGFHPTMLTNETEGIPARVTAVHRERYELICKYGQIFSRLKAGVYYTEELQTEPEPYPTAGDFVLIQYNNIGDSLIIKTLDRKSSFSRNDFSGHKKEYVKNIREQVVAANFDYVFIMASLNHDFNVRRIERYLIQSWQSGAVPVVVLTKSDLVDDFSGQVREVEKAAAGVGVFAVSAKTGYGLDALSAYLKPRKTIVFLGSSGVGKSSLVNALAGEDRMAVKKIREDDSKGRHTTTHRQLMMLPSGFMVIDTPGMREIGMWDIGLGLSETFSDVECFLGQCRFSDCRHQSEPGCAIKQAIESGKLTQERWDSYMKLKSEAEFVEDKSAYLRNKQEWHKSISKWSKQMKRSGEIQN